jgi:DNA-directed RNA polymerase specialized sigma24 family protein
MTFMSEITDRHDLQSASGAKSNNNPNAAQEVVRAGFLKAYRQLAQFRENSRHVTALLEIVLNQCLVKMQR